jgi:serine/threonine-protein kinase
VQVFDVGECAGVPFYSMELCTGGSLADRLRGGPLPPREAAALVGTLARAIHAAHEADIVHRDIKPANVLLAADGTPKITDFGLAKRLDAEGVTASGSVMGTPAYMPPEQAGGRTSEVGPAADIYSLGAVLYECLTGRPPFRGQSMSELVLQVLNEAPPTPRSLNPTVPRDLEAVCLTCLNKDPRRRFPSARDLADDLARFLNGEAVRARGSLLIDQLADTLERSRMDVAHASWAGMLFAWAAMMAVTNVVQFLGVELGGGQGLELAINGLKFILGGGIYLWWQWGRLVPRTTAERQMLSVWVAYLLGASLMAVVESTTAAPVPPASRLDLYPRFSVLAGMIFFVLGGTLWGRMYLFAGGFFLLALLMPYWPVGSPLLFGLAWALALTLTGLHLRALTRH